MMASQRVPTLLVATYFIFFSFMETTKSYRNILVILIACSIFHLAFMRYSSIPRYEGYIVGCSVIVCSMLFFRYAQKVLPQNTATSQCLVFFAIAFTLVPLILRSWNSFDRVVPQATSIFDQPYQMGLFVHKYYDQEAVAINDIGAVPYLTEGKKLDILGLGNNEIAKSILNNKFTSHLLDSLSKEKSVKIAIVYDYNLLPLEQNWKKIASWYIPYKDNGPNDSVSFYAVTNSEAPRLLDNLKQYQHYLSRRIIVKYYY